ncbi:carbon-nitrogen hydrolase family protein [Brachybacterium tyrofermentans]
MTADRALKKRVRARMSRTGESYTAALRHLRSTPGDTVPTQPITPDPTNATDPTTDRALRLATAQTTPQHHPSDADAFHCAGEEVRSLMRRAGDLGADLIQFPEATLSFPDKVALSRSSEEITESEWTRFAWDALEAELAEVRAAAKELALWTVIGSQTRAQGASRPRTSLLVIDPQGRVHAQYDERRLSRTKGAFMYEQGTEAVTISIHGIVLGLASGLEVLFEDVFRGYEDAGADAVLLCSQGPGDPVEGDAFAISARAAARHHGLSIGYSVPTSNAPYAPAGVIGPDGRWLAICPAQQSPAVVVQTIARRPGGASRDWRRAMVDAD